MKQRQDKIVCLTAYDATLARLVDEAGVDVVLVGDSLGMVIQGQPTTLAVSMDDMAYHTACTARGVRRAFILADLPFMSCATPTDAAHNAARLIRAGAHAVKIEGAGPYVSIIRFLTERNVAVCAHLGLLPQSVYKLGGYKMQAREPDSARQLLTDAGALADAGASLLVLECVPPDLALKVTENIPIPTIGIGAGPHCDGQVLVLYDMLGLSPKRPWFCKDFLAESGTPGAAVRHYVAEVRGRRFPPTSPVSIG
ncbi:MAG: 3-methyl-2-oxobutanoate hydroxymethyltransferase [Methylotetracoccus sp.]|nr:3-methyl-2-oxobutanoate hydroxymethyltransferase [Methylotetracoccus sp.]